MFKSALNLLNKSLGNSVEIDRTDVREQFPTLVGSEEIHLAYKLIRDLIVITDKRLIHIDKQGVTGKKIEFHSIMLKSITQLSSETTGHMDMESELKVWVSGAETPYVFTFGSGVDIIEIQRVIVEHM